VPKLRSRPRITAAVVALLMVAGGLATFGAIGGGASTPFALDVTVSASTPPGSAVLTSSMVSTSGSNELLVAFIAADGPAREWSQSITSVRGGGLTWTRTVRSNEQMGTAEVWTAVAASPLIGVTIKAIPLVAGFEGSITVAAFKGARTSIANVHASDGLNGEPTVGLTTSTSGAWVWAMGYDWDNGVPRTPASGQSLAYQLVDTHIGNTFWVQHGPTAGTAGTHVVIQDELPTTDRWDYAAVEIDPANVQVAGQPPSTTTTTAAPASTTSTTADPPSTTSTTTAPPSTTSTSAAPPLPSGSSGAGTGAAGLCGLTQAAFCDTFDAPAGTGNRSGDLNGAVWGVSRLGDESISQGVADGVVPPTLNDCGNTATVAPPHDIVICNGQLHDSVNDGGGVTALAMYAKQPFDFAGRTGHIVFDVSNDSGGTHSAWPELWVTDQPVPAPFTHLGSELSLPRNGFGIRFAACTNNLACVGGGTVSVDSAVVVNNYVARDSAWNGGVTVTGLDMVTKSGPGQMNHYEVDVSQNGIEVYATDAFTPGQAMPPLKHIATIPSPGLTFTRGLVWIEDAHYNADKPCAFNNGPPCQRNHTFTWDNVGFDGPVLPQDRAFDVLDRGTPGSNSEVNLGWKVSSPVTLSTMPIDSASLANATGALLTFNYYIETAPVTLSFSVNGHAHSLAWPYPDNRQFTNLTIGIPIPLSDVQTGVNTITFSPSGYAMNVANIDLIMVGGGGIVHP